MNDNLTQHYLSLKWDKNFLKNIDTSSISKDTVVSVLDNTLSEWSCETTNMITVNGGLVVSVNLYLPGRVLSNVGISTNDAIVNIIKDLTISNQQSVTNNQSNISTNSSKVTAESITQQINEMKNNIQQNQEQKQSSSDVFKDLMDFSNVSNVENVTVEQYQEEVAKLPEELPFDSPEAKAVSTEFNQFGTVGVNKPVIQPTAQEVNPTNQLYGNSAWDTENGTKLKQWMNENEVTNPQQLSSWLNRFCGLDYEHFNPAFTDQFIAWTKVLRESQTY